jgi:hypothetical protein
VTHGLDERIHLWLTQLAKDWGRPSDQVAKAVAADEIRNRLQVYPDFSSVLSKGELDLDEFRKVARNCWALAGRYDSIRFGNFMNKEESAAFAIMQLLRSFPEGRAEIAERIDDFVDRTVQHGYKTPSGSADWAGVALLGSIILTSVFPSRFVDFRQSRWNRFAEAFGYARFPAGERRYGAKMIWAGEFAADISKTSTFRKYWSEAKGEPLWIVAGLCWTGLTPTPPVSPLPALLKSMQKF